MVPVIKERLDGLVAKEGVNVSTTAMVAPLASVVVYV
jgi:hypothetical protein